MFSNLPASIKALLLLLGGASALAVAVVLFSSYPQVVGIILVGILVVGLLLAAYLVLLKLLNKGKDTRFARMLKGQGSAVPSSISGAQGRARLDDLRRNFERGLERFQAAGKSLYSLPWYMIVGEPGSGKTEAIRHCNISFPPGLQDEQQGAGGTVNMDWWFTNHGVILDTAGRLIFEEVDASATSEWKEFLKLLKQNRLNCPVNGLLLVIPAESLIKDTAEEISRKGGKIAQQLDLIQRTLDVRFPVFVVITKSDLINGFREFFDSITDPEMQHQVMGWSNPLPIDEPFNAELVDQHLETVLNRLRRRRLGLLQDPVNTENPDARRSDQVDTLYDFPHSLSRVIPRLRLYLEKIFVVGEWSARPLFIRGIYFTSSMREGSALDEDLADALGVKVTELPADERFWERERAYFLRDVFMNKVFKEHGLVTRATNASRQHQRRKLSVLAACFLSVLILMLLTGYGAVSLKRSIGHHRDYMTAAAQEANWVPDEDFVHWTPIVYAPDFKGSFVYSTQEAVEVGGSKITSSQFHADLWRLNQSPIEIPWIFGFAKIGKHIDKLRAEAQRVLFEASVLHPLITAARLKMQASDAPWTDEAKAALEELIRIETYALRSGSSDAGRAGDGATLPLPDMDRLFRHVLRCDPAGKASPEGAESKGSEGKRPCDDYLNDRNKVVFQQILTDLYAGAAAQAQWPPEWVPEGVSFAENKTLTNGVKRQIARCVKTEEVQALTAVVERIRKFQPKLDEFLQAETAFLQASEKKLLDEFGDGLAKADTLADVDSLLKRWAEAFNELSLRGQKPGGGIFEGEQADVSAAVDAEFQSIRKLLNPSADAGGSVEDAYNAAVAQGVKQVRACLNRLSLPDVSKPEAEGPLDKAQEALKKKALPAGKEKGLPEGAEPPEKQAETKEEKQAQLVRDIQAAIQTALDELEARQLKDEQTLQLLKRLEGDFRQVKEVLALYRFITDSAKDARMADLKAWTAQMAAIAAFRTELKEARESQAQKLLELEEAFVDRFTSELPKPATLREFTKVSGDWDGRYRAMVEAGGVLETKAKALETQFSGIKKGLSEIAGSPDAGAAEAYSKAVGKWLFELEKLLAKLPEFKGTPFLAKLKPKLEGALESVVSKKLRYGECVEQIKKAETEYAQLADMLAQHKKRLQMYTTADQQLKAKEAVPDMAQLGQVLDQLDRNTELAAAEVAKYADPKAPLSAKAEKVATFACELANRKRRYDLMNGILVTSPTDVEEVKKLVMVRTKALVSAKETRNDVMDSLQRPKIYPTRLDGGMFDDGFYWKAAADILRGWKSLAKRFAAGQESRGKTTIPVLDAEELAKKHQEMSAVFASYVKSYYNYWREQVPGELEPSGETYLAFHETLKNIDRKEYDNVILGLEKLCIALESAFNEVDDAISDEETVRFRKSNKVVRDEKFKTSSVRMEQRWREVLRNWIALGDRALDARQIQLQDLKELEKKYLPFSFDDKTPEAVVDRYWAALTGEAQRLLLHECRLVIVNMIKELKEQYARFPLVKPLATDMAGELTAEQFLQARSRLKKIGVALDSNDTSMIEEKDLEWVKKVRRLAESLPESADEKWECALAVLKPAEQVRRALNNNPFSDIWAEVSLAMAGAERNRISTRAEADVEWKVQYPGKPFGVGFFRFVHDEKAEQTVEFAGPWAVLRLLVYGDKQKPKMTRSEDGGTWEVPLVLKDKEGTERVMWVKAQFKRPVPAVQDWASKP
jgi:hypothetical protein